MAEIGRSAIRAPLSGWRNIAAYLACDQSTVKRWAATRNLPVYRPAGSEARKGVPVFAYPDEIDHWLRGQSSGSRSEPAAELRPPPAVKSEEAISALPPTPPSPRRRGRRLLFAVVAVTAVLTAGAGILLAQSNPGSAVVHADPFRGVPAEARQLYLDAYYLWQKRTPESLSEAQRLLTQALEKAPRFARAEADLATVYDLMVEYDVTRPEVGYALSRDAAERALEIDPTLAQPHSVLGDIVFFWDRDYDGGLDHFRRAVELDSTDVLSRHWYASALMGTGRFDEAAKQIEVARELEPLSRSIIVSEAMIRLGQGQPARARDLLAGLVANEPEYRNPYRFLAFCALALKDYDGYLSALRTRFELTGDPAAGRIVAAGEAALREGGNDGMVKALREAAVTNADLVKDPSMVAHFLAVGGDWQGAVEWLARTPSRRFSYYGIDPAYDHAKQSPAFREAIAAAGIPAIW